MHTKHLGILLKLEADSVGLGQGLGICIPNELPGLPLLLIHKHILSSEGLEHIPDNIWLLPWRSFQSNEETDK